MKIIFLFTFLAVNFITFGQTKNNSFDKKIDSYLNEIKIEKEISGIALAIIKNNNLVFKKYYGFSNLDYEVPITDKTIFPLFSTSKIFATVAVHKLIQEKKLNLGDKISKYLTGLPVNWKNIQIKNLLSHSSGLPEIAVYEKEPEEVAKTKVYKDPLKFKKGYNFD